MLGLKKINKKVFTKLYRYYWQKLLRKWWMLAFYLVLGIVIGVANFYTINSLVMGRCQTWQEILTGFFLLSAFQLIIMWMITSFLVNELVGLTMSFGYFQKPKKDNADDLKVLVFTPSVNRETVILAKFYLALAVFWGISFLLITLPLFFYLLTFPNLSLPLNLLFLLLSGVVWAVQNFLLLVPSNFYFVENYSPITAFLQIFYFFFLTLSFISFWFLSKYFVFAVFFHLPFSGLVGYFFWSLYCRKFLKKDIS